MKTRLSSLIAIVIILTISSIPEAQAMRWYSPSTGRWFSRDPIEEQGGMNVYLFARNRPLDAIDFFGQFPIPIPVMPYSIDSKAGWLLVSAGMYGAGLPMSGYLLAHSILWPTDIPQYATAIGPMKSAPEYSAFLSSIPDGNFPNFVSTSGITFTSDNDLYAAFRSVDASYKGCKSGSSHLLDLRIDDVYDFHFTPITGKNITQVLATLGANAAYISQMLGDIHKFHVTVSFSDP